MLSEHQLRLNRAASRRWKERHKDDPAYWASRKQSAKDWWAKHGRDLMYRKRRGITLVEFEAKIAAQNNRCPIGNHEFGSGKQWNAPAQDHDHETGKNRDALCRTHNAALGGFHDSVEEIEAALIYIKKHKGEKI